MNDVDNHTETPDATPGRASRSRNTALFVLGLFLFLLILLGTVLVLLAPLLDPATGSRDPEDFDALPLLILTPEEIAALDDSYAFRILASAVFPADADIVARSHDMPETEDKILDDAGGTLAAWVDIPSGEQKQYENGGILLRFLSPSPGETEPHVQALVLYGPYDLFGRELIENLSVGLMTSHTPTPLSPVQIPIGFLGPMETRMRELTRTNFHMPGGTGRTEARRLAVILDGEIVMAAAIQSVIGGQAVISFGSDPKASGRAREIERKIRQIKQSL